MANREMKRYITNAYTTKEGVSVKEEYVRFPLRSEQPGVELKPKDICLFQLVTFEKKGSTPVFWVREKAENICGETKLMHCVDGVMVGELNDSRHNRLSPETIALYVERNDQSVKQIPYFTPSHGTTDRKCNREKDDELQASHKAIDIACKSNLSCKENLATTYLQTQTPELHKEQLPRQSKHDGKPTREELWQKLETLNQEK